MAITSGVFPNEKEVEETGEADLAGTRITVPGARGWYTPPWMSAWLAV